MRRKAAGPWGRAGPGGAGPDQVTAAPQVGVGGRGPRASELVQSALFLSLSASQAPRAASPSPSSRPPPRSPPDRRLCLCLAPAEAGEGRPRFLKAPSAGSGPAAAPRPAAPGRAAAVLRRLARIESHIRRRQSRASAQDEDEEGGLWSPPSGSSAGSAAAPAALPAPTAAARPKEAPPPTGHGGGGGWRPLALGRQEESEGEPGGSAQPRPAGKNSQLNIPTRTPLSPPIKKSSPTGRSSLKRLLHKAPSPPSSNTPVLSGGTSPSLSSSISDNLAGKASLKMDERSLSEGSIIRSLDELFSGPASHQDSSSSDFQVNVLSLADLAPEMADQNEGLIEEATVMEISGSLSMELEQNLFFADTQSALKPPSAAMEKAAALAEDPEETEISEQLSGSSVEYSSDEQENSAQYSDDFDPLSEDIQRQSSSEDSQDELDTSLQAGLSDPSSPCLPLLGTKSSQAVKLITTKEAAVQTNSSLLMPHGLKTAAAATIDWIAESPVASSPVVSMETLEELTTYRPAMSALNDMLKQNLLLLQQFIEASRHLHLSFVALLEKEEFHYHTLEEAKLYIDHHKCPPLTLEQALHKLEKQNQVAV